MRDQPRALRRAIPATRPDGRGLAVSASTPSSTRRAAVVEADRPARPRRRPRGSRISPSRAPRTASTAGRSTASRSSRRAGGRERAVGLRGRARRLGRRARALGDHVHRIRPGGPGGVPRDDRGLPTVERYGIVRHPEDKNAALLPTRSTASWILFHRPTSGSAARARRDHALALRRPRQLERARARAAPRTGAWWDSLRIGIGPPPLETEHGWLLVYHGVKETVAGSSTASDSPCSTSSTRPASAPGARLGSRAARRPTSVRATCRTPSSPAVSCTTQATASFASTTAPPTRSICLATAPFADVLAAVLEAPPEPS